MRNKVEPKGNLWYSIKVRRKLFAIIPLTAKTDRLLKFNIYDKFGVKDIEIEFELPQELFLKGRNITQTLITAEALKRLAATFLC